MTVFRAKPIVGRASTACELILYVAFCTCSCVPYNKFNPQQTLNELLVNLQGDNVMRIIKIPVLLLVVSIGLAAVFITLGLLGTTSEVLAQEQAETEPTYIDPFYQPPPPDPDEDLQFIAFFTDEVPIQITDLSGNVLGEGLHQGEVKCNSNNCSQKTVLSVGYYFTDPVTYEYQFTTRQALDPEEERVVVSGKGRISSDGQKERFSFTATFQNNRDGTVWVRYEASIPDASFIIPYSSGTFEIFRRR